MTNKKRILWILSVFVIMSMLSGCQIVDNMAIKMNFRNEDFEYIKENKVDKIIIQNVRDSGFRFIVNDSKAINNMYKILARAKVENEKSSLDPDYVFEVHIGDEVKKYDYVFGSDSNEVGNFYDENNSYSVSKKLQNIIMENMSFIRKPRDFDYIYYQSILKIVQNKKDSISGNKVGIDISKDSDCLKYVSSVDLVEFIKKVQKEVPNVELVKNNSEDFDVVITSKNRGFSSTVFKTLVTVENKIDNSVENYYVSAEYGSREWKIKVSEVNAKPKDW